MFGKKLAIELNKEKIDVYSIAYSNKRIEINESNIENAFKGKECYLIIKNQDFLVKYLDIPLVKENVLKSLIALEVKNSYSAIKDIIYDYKVLRKDRKKLKIMIICISCRKLNEIERNASIKIKNVNLIQFYFLKYINIHISYEKYIAVFSYEDTIYNIIYENGNIYYSNTMSKSSFINDKKRIFEDISEYFKDKNIISYNMYLINIEDIEIPGSLKETIQIVNLGMVKKEQLFYPYINYKSSLEKYNLLPNWYRQLKCEKIKRLRNSVISFLIILNFISIGLYIINNNRWEKLQQAMSEQDNIELNEKANDIQLDKTVKAYDLFLRKLDKQLKYVDAEIKDNKIYMKVAAKDESEYLKNVKYIEGLKEFQIINLDKLKKYKETYSFTISIEVNGL